jgi:hypothetical protein
MKWNRVKRLLFSHTDSIFWTGIVFLFTSLDRTLSRTKLYSSVSDSTCCSQSASDLCNDVLSISHFSQRRMSADLWKDELEGTWKETFVAKFEILSLNLTGVTEEYHLRTPDLKMRHSENKWGVSNIRLWCSLPNSRVPIADSAVAALGARWVCRFLWCLQCGIYRVCSCS